MSSIIIVDLNGFAVEKPITVFQNGKQTVSTKARMSDIADYCANLITKYGVQSLKVIGAPGFAAQVAGDIRDVSKREYNYSLVEIEVITK